MLESDILNLINAHRPTQVGDVLRKRLIAADEADKKVASLESCVSRFKAEIAQLESRESVARGILAREEALTKAEAKLHADQIECRVRGEVLQARSDIICNQLDRDERLLLAVFSNNRFKYQMNETVAFPPAPASQYEQCPYPKTAQQSRTVEGEGTPAGPT